MKNISLWSKALACSLSFLLIAMASLTSAAAQAVAPVNGTPITLIPVTINNGAGDQYDPHISGDWTAYTSDSSIRYYNFATNTDAAIPMGSSARDLLSDISGSKIVFSRVITAVKTAVMVFETATAATPIEIDAAVGSNRIGSAIGGNTVAYMDFGLEAHGEVVIHDLTTSTSQRITNDVLFAQNPSVSPDGAVVTWEQCSTSTTNCDIWQAVKSGAVWTVSAAANSANPEANPDTNGSLVVYDSIRGLDRGDIFWRPVGGGAELQLQLPSVEANPSIAGNLIAFESRPTLFSTSDIFAYDIATNLLYQITDTPLVTEQLNDITVLPDGKIRVVWASDEDDFDQRNVKGATFSLPAVEHNFSGFLQPVENLPILNVINAGQAVPVKFSLSGYKGLNIFAAGYPISSQILCESNEPGAVIEETVVAGGSSLSYDAAADLYTYVWKTSKAWKNSCRIFAVRLSDGSDHFAKFRFR